LEAYINLPKYIRFFIEVLRKAGPLSTEWRANLDQIHAARLIELSNETGLGLSMLRKLKTFWIPSAIHNLSTCRLICAFFARAGREAALRLFANEISQLLSVRYVVFGHTHEVDLHPLLNGPPQAEYVNSGTWTKIFAARSEERHLLEESEFAFVRIDREKPRIELLRWLKDQGKERRVCLLQRTMGGRKGVTMPERRKIIVDLIVLFLLGAFLASLGDWFHVHTQTTSYSPERFVWGVKVIPFWIPPLFGIAGSFFGIAYYGAKKMLRSILSFREGAQRAHIILAGLVYIAMHVSSGYIPRWGFPLPDLLLALPVFLIWLLLDRTSGGACFSIFVALVGVSAEICLVHWGKFAFSDTIDKFCGVATWLPWIYIAGGLAVGRFIERRLSHEI
jgi:hypothetical protein